MIYKVVDFWYKHKAQKFKIGDWFYLYNGKTIKLTSQEVINIKLGIKLFKKLDWRKTIL